MKNRRGSLWGGGLENMIAQFKPGDIVKPVVVEDIGFLGTVREVDPRINKILVAWGGGSIKQHDPDEIMLLPLGLEAYERMQTASRRGSIEKDSRIARERDEECPNCEWKGNTSYMDYDERRHTLNCPECGKTIITNYREKNSSLKSRRAMYWCSPDRTYRLTQQEQESGSALCPKCKCNMDVESFTRNEKLMICPQCRFKVPTSKAVKKNVEVKVPEDVSVTVTQMDENGEEVQGETVMAGRRMKNAADILAFGVEPEELARLPQMKLDEIAYIISKDWKNVYFGAKPYLQAMATMRDIKENYGMDSGTSIVAYFLSNATSWRGEVAKAVKLELNKRLKRAR